VLEWNITEIIYSRMWNFEQTEPTPDLRLTSCKGISWTYGNLQNVNILPCVFAMLFNVKHHMIKAQVFTFSFGH